MTLLQKIYNEHYRLMHQQEKLRDLENQLQYNGIPDSAIKEDFIISLLHDIRDTYKLIEKIR